jgi:motility quorum-sensing regulator/GCU-specific mRNA interferase toxin
MKSETLSRFDYSNTVCQISPNRLILNNSPNLAPNLEPDKTAPAAATTAAAVAVAVAPTVAAAVVTAALPVASSIPPAKLPPHTPLGTMQALAAAGKVSTTMSSLASAAALDMDVNDMITTVLGLTMDDFYKTMPVITDSSRWQDVYHAKTAIGLLYVKLQLDNGAVNMRIVSFKEK